MRNPSATQQKAVTEMLGEGWSLLPRNPAAAEGKARAALAVLPGHPGALLLQGQAWTALDQPDEALEAYRQAAELAPELPQPWRMLANSLYLRGDWAGADQAYARLIKTSVREPRLREIATSIKAGRGEQAHAGLRSFLKAYPHDVVALRMLATMLLRSNRLTDAEPILRDILSRAPSFDDVRTTLATVLLETSRPLEAIAEVDRLLMRRTGDVGLLKIKSSALERIGEYGHAAACLEMVLEHDPNDAQTWMALGYIRRVTGNQREAVSALRRSLELQPTLGEAWWSLADLNADALVDEDLVHMEAARTDPALRPAARVQLAFALGRARENRGEDAAAFASYSEGNRVRRAEIQYDPAAVELLVDRSISMFTPAFFASRARWGATERDPIFVLGMPRAGSTLIEQILASHPDIEGTQELPDMPVIARRLSRHVPGRTDYYPFQVGDLTESTAASLGADYLKRTNVQRKTTRPLFIDKRPSNWMNIGLIHLIIPNATIIDARRHPLGCCLSNFKQHFARGSDFSYDLADLGRYYSAYVRLMAHFDRVLPGRIYRVFHETIVDDTEGEVRRLLDRVGVKFDPTCLRFHETERSVRTASSEQVRRPIFREGLDQWRRFDPWLGPLKAALGPVLECYPAAPSTFTVPSIEADL